MSEKKIANQRKQSQQTNEMEAYFERIKTSAEHLAKEVFPQKALELDTIINVRGTI